MPIRFDNVYGNIYRGGAPSLSDLKILSNVFGIKRIISLDGEIGSALASICDLLNLDHIIIPVGGVESELLIEFLKDHISSLLLDKPVYVHCKHGSDRTGMAIAFFRIKNQGWTPEKAILEAKRYGFGNKLDQETAELYLDKINNCIDSNMAHDNFHSLYDALMPVPYQKPGNVIGDDIVSEMRDYFNFGDVPPAFNPQQSFNIKDDIKFGPPREPLNNVSPLTKDPAAPGMNSHLDLSPSVNESRKQKLKYLLLEVYPEYVPFVGQYDNYSGIRGVGPVETGNFLNI